MVKKSKNLQKFQKISKNQFFQKNFLKDLFFAEKKKKKKCYPLGYPILGGRDSTRALQFTPFQNPGGVVCA